MTINPHNRRVTPDLERKLMQHELVDHNLTLGIYGDSFADTNFVEVCDPNNLGHLPWPAMVLQHYLAKEDLQLTDEEWDRLLKGHINVAPVEIKSAGGTNLWWSLNNFIRDLNRFPHIDNVVFVHTNPQRMHSVLEPNHHKAFSTPRFGEMGEFEDIKDGDEFEQFVQLYYKFSHDKNFNYLLGQMVFDLLNKLAKKHDINLINVMPFYHTDPAKTLGEMVQPDLGFQHGTVISGLQNICMAESGSIEGYVYRQDYHSHWFNPPGYNFFGRDLRMCHMNVPNNVLVAQTVIDNLENNKPKQFIDLYEENKWHSSPELWNYYNTAPWIEDYTHED